MRRAVPVLGLWLSIGWALAGPRAVLVDGDGPWRDGNWKVAAREFRRMLRDAGYEVRMVAPLELSLNAAATDACWTPSGIQIV